MVARRDEKRLQNVVSSGEQLHILETMLEMLAERFDTASDRDTAAIARQIQAVLDQIVAIRDGLNQETDEFDDFLENLGIDLNKGV